MYTVRSSEEPFPLCFHDEQGFYGRSKSISGPGFEGLLRAKIFLRNMEPQVSLVRHQGDIELWIIFLQLRIRRIYHLQFLPQNQDSRQKSTVVTWAAEDQISSLL